MAVAAYTTDLTVIVDMDGTTGTAAEPDSVYTAGRSPIANDTDFTIEGTNHASLTFNATGKGGVVVPGSSRSWTSGDYLFGWLVWLAPGAISTKSGGGLSMLCGSAVTALKVFYVGGSDFGSYPYGGWQNFAVDPTGTADETIGSTPTSFYVVGAGANCIQKVNKGNPLGFDVFRYGRGEIRIVGGTSTDNDATFTGMAAANDANTARWGLFQAIEGGYKWKGLMYFGYGNPTDFTDSDRSIVVDNVDQVSSNFNRIEIHNASSVIDWTNINITSLSTVSPGEFEMIDDATVDIDTCVFTDMSTFVFDSNATLADSTFRRCGQVTQAGATITSCLFERTTATAALVVDDIDLLTTCSFVSDGSSHAVNLGTITATDTIAWGHSISGYATTDGSTGNETILVSVNVDQTLTINVAAGLTSPSVKNDGSGSVSVLAGQVTLEVEIRDAVSSATISGARVYTETTTGGDMSTGIALISGSLTDAEGIASDTRSYTANQPFTGWVRKASESPYYRTSTFAGTVDNSSGLSVVVQMIKDE